MIKFVPNVESALCEIMPEMLSHELGLTIRGRVTLYKHFAERRFWNLKIGSKSYEFMTMHTKIFRIAKVKKSSLT